jgi:hypothetical protein
LSYKEARKTIDDLTSDNFSSSLSSLEPFLIQDAGVTFYKKSMKRIATKAKALGESVPTGYAKEAKATQKRREKQDEFIKAKIEEAAAAAAEEASAEEEAPAE